MKGRESTMQVPNKNKFMKMDPSLRLFGCNACASEMSLSPMIRHMSQ